MKKRADGRYQANVYIGKVNNKPKYKSVYATTQKELNEKIIKIKTENKKGLDVLQSNTDFKTWGEMYLQQQKLKQTPHIYTTKKYYVEYFNNYIGDMSINKIKAYHIENALTELAICNERTHKPTSLKTIKEYRAVASQVFKFAIKNRVIDFNPCEYAELPNTKTPPKKRRALTKNERDAIANCKCYAHYIAMTSIYAGMRKGELAALTHSDIDLKNGIIYVNKSYDYHNHEMKGTKTDAGERIVPIPQILIDCLKTLPKRSIFAFSVNGGKLTSNNWERLLNDLLIEMESIIGGGKQVEVGNKFKALISFPNFGWHDLRHTYATLLYESGIGMDAKYLLGHTDYTTTMNIYTHISQEQTHRSIEKLNNYISQHISQTS